MCIRDRYHFTGANFGRDFTVSKLADIAEAATGHRCAVCGGRLEAKKAIEVGHCFKPVSYTHLGTWPLEPGT